MTVEIDIQMIYSQSAAKILSWRTALSEMLMRNAMIWKSDLLVASGNVWIGMYDMSDEMKTDCHFES